MVIREAIIRKIKEEQFVTASVSESSSLYLDLGFDSLSFIVLLTEIERMFSITINIDEMENCIQVGELITLVKSKMRQEDRCDGQTAADRAEGLE